MTDKSKKTFLLSTIVGSFLVYSIVYYSHVFKNAPYNFKEFRSFVFKYGTRNNMVNYYNSATGEYDHLNKNDSLIKSHLQLSYADLDSLHRNAADIGLWDFPEQETTGDTANSDKVPRYYIEFNYKRKSKKVTYDANFIGPPKLVEANRALIGKIRSILSNAEDRERK